MTIDDQVGSAIARSANGILWMWRELHLEADRLCDCWYKQERRQAYQDTINCMVTNGLIEDFDMLKCQVKINGRWTSASRTTLI